MDKKYLKTHPWITFLLDTSKTDPQTWLLLGEAQSKCKHLAGTLLDPEIAQRLHRMYLVKGVRATTAIEGNTLTEEQINSLLDGAHDLPKSKEYLAIEAENIVAACNEIMSEQVNLGPTTLCTDEIKKFNSKVLNNLQLEDWVIRGKIRGRSVTVGRYLGAPAEDCEYLLERLCQMLENPAFSFGDDFTYANGILKAIIAHLYIAWIHPFGDGNGRTARLIEFKICVASGIPDIAAHLLSNHYNETRTEYYRVLDETSKAKSPYPFIKYALQGYVDQLSEQIEVIREAQCKAFWANYVHKIFHQKGDSKVNTRRRTLMLDISDNFFDTINLSKMYFKTTDWLDISKIPDASPRVARLYAPLGERALNRDVNELIRLNLLKKKGNKVHPHFAILSSFMPRLADSHS